MQTVFRSLGATLRTKFSSSSGRVGHLPWHASPTLIASGWLLEWLDWPALLYIFGALEQRRFITDTERRFISDSLQTTKSTRQKEFLKS